MSLRGVSFGRSRFLNYRRSGDLALATVWPFTYCRVGSTWVLYFRSTKIVESSEGLA